VGHEHDTEMCHGGEAELIDEPAGVLLCVSISAQVYELAWGRLTEMSASEPTAAWQ
jgi:hypothetical protein